MTQIFTEDGKFFFCECGAKVSVDAKACPSCGDAKAKAKAEARFAATRPIYVKMIPWIIIGLIVFGISKCVSSIEPPDPNAVRDCISGNSVNRSVRYGIKQKLNNPDSFEFVSARKIASPYNAEHVWHKNRAYEIVFRAQNAFGGVVTGSGIVGVDNQCEPVYSIIKE